MIANKYFNTNGCEIMDEKIFGSNPTGFVNFNKPKYLWSKNLYDLMNANTWFPSEINTLTEKKQFNSLTENEQNIYKLTFAQLSFNDSIQESYLSDFRNLATNKIVQASLSLQQYQETNHSNSYAVLLDACGNSDEVFNLYRTNTALNEKNIAISEHFAQAIQGKNSAEKMLLSAMASVNLEGIFFLCGFGYIYTLGDKVSGARDMVKFIARDELNTHAPLFANIFRVVRNENKLGINIIDKVHLMISKAVEIELKYANYLLDNYPIMGLTKEVVTNTVYNFANSRLKAVGLEPIFTQSKETYLQKLINQHLDMGKVRTNFFEGNVSNYSKGSLDMSNF